MKSKFEKTPDLGKIHYRVKYDNANSSLNVTIVECKNLKKMDTFGKSDPFVRIYLMPGSHPEMKTKTIKKTLDPQFKEQFSFTISREEAIKRTIVLQVFDWDK